ncbi:MAG: glycerol-3-phosphate 1-O-acyltransferase PlsY [Gemmatimonadota bacterium]
MTVPLLLVALAYLLGATPTSYWVGQAFYGLDLRKVGSGNLGATNAYRALGARAAVPVMLVDLLKGWAPVALFPRFAPEASFGWTLGYGAAAILGHVFSFWVRLRGGKGVATSAGVFVALAPWAVLVALGVWVGAVLLTGYVSLGSILAAVTLPIAMLFTPHPGGRSALVFAIALALFVIGAHRSNIRRLLRGDERRFGRRRGGSPPRDDGGPGAAGAPGGKPLPGSGGAVVSGPGGTR